MIKHKRIIRLVSNLFNITFEVSNFDNNNNVKDIEFAKINGISLTLLLPDLSLN
jgi:hypothetical protein